MSRVRWELRAELADATLWNRGADAWRVRAEVAGLATVEIFNGNGAEAKARALFEKGRE